MANNPGPNIVNPVITRGASVVSIPAGVISAPVGLSYSRFAVPGVLPGDVVSISPNVAPNAGVAIVNSFVDTADSVTVVYLNSTAGAVSIVADTYNAYIARGYPVVYDFGVTILNNSGIVAATNP